MAGVKAGNKVRMGIQVGRVLRLERRHGIDGAVVQTASGALPHWVPLSGLTVVEE